MIFPFEGRLWVFFFFPSCANLFLKERRTGVVPTDLSPSSSSSSSSRRSERRRRKRSGFPRRSVYVKGGVSSNNKEKFKEEKTGWMRCAFLLRLSTKWGRPKRFKKEVQTCLGFWILIFFLIFLRACALCWRILFFGEPQS